MDDELEIKPLTTNEIPALVRLVNSAYRGDNSKKGWTTEADLLEGIRTSEADVISLMQQQDSIILAARQADQKLVGCVYLNKDQNSLYLGMLTVAPDIQSQGIGKKLMAAAQSYALAHQCTSIKMTVIDCRHELIKWYLRQGYHSTGEVKPFPSDPAFGIPTQPLQFMVLQKVLD